MAVPSLNLSTAASFRPSYQDYLSKWRQNEDDNRAKWGDTAKYFQESQVSCVKNNQWGSEQSFHNSLETFAAEQMQDVQKERLMERRNLLKQLLREEEKLFKLELKNISNQSYNFNMSNMTLTSRSNEDDDRDEPIQAQSSTSHRPAALSARVENMRKRVEQLQSAREEKRREIAKAKLYQHWRENSTDVRALESEQLQKHVVDQWSGQVENKSKERLEEERRRMEEERQMEVERQMAIERMAMEENKKRQARKEIEHDLIEQMEQLKIREREANKMRIEQEALMQQQWSIQQLESQRAALEKQRAGFELGRFLVQQYRAQLRRRFEQHRVERNQDILLLENLQRLAEREEEEKSELQKKRMEEIKEALEAAKNKQRMDAEMEQQLDNVYRDEAERIWRKREAEWAAEQNARANLMQMVLNERSMQVKDRLNKLEMAKRENIEERERAMKEMELLRIEAEAEQLEKEEEKIGRREELEAAITARKEAAISARLELEQEINLQKQQEEQMKEMYEEEKRVITARGYQPKSYGILKQQPPKTSPEVGPMPGMDFDVIDTRRSGGGGDAAAVNNNDGMRINLNLDNSFHNNNNNMELGAGFNSPSTNDSSRASSARSARPHSNSQQRHFVNNIWGGHQPSSNQEQNHYNHNHINNTPNQNNRQYHQWAASSPRSPHFPPS